MTPPTGCPLTDLRRFPVWLLDMNGTFMFDEDRFGPGHDYHATCAILGGGLPRNTVMTAVDACYRYLDARYPDPDYHNAFPTVRDALRRCPETAALCEADRALIDRVFALHERGRIPDAYAGAVRCLAAHHRLGLVADIWAEKSVWLDELDRVTLGDAFEVLVFSSDHGCVKPSPRAFQIAMERLDVRPESCVMVGDSARRDVGGAQAAGIAAVWIGTGAPPPGAAWSMPDFIDLVEALYPTRGGRAGRD